MCVIFTPIICWKKVIYDYEEYTSMTTKRELEAKVAELESKLSKKTTKKASIKAQKIVSKVEDGFHDYARLESLTGGKDIKISAITKDGKITGFYLANMFPNYDGKAKGLHIPSGMKEIVFDKLDKCEIKNLA